MCSSVALCDTCSMAVDLKEWHILWLGKIKQITCVVLLKQSAVQEWYEAQGLESSLGEQGQAAHRKADVLILFPDWLKGDAFREDTQALEDCPGDSGDEKGAAAGLGGGTKPKEE